MGQSQGANLETKRAKNHGPTSDADKSQKAKKNRSTLVAPKQAFTLENILTPNGMYPPEILELIMVHMDMKTMLSASISCKLWMETSYQAAKRLYRQEFDPSIDELLNMDYRETYLKLSKAKNNLIKGLYWPEVLCSQYRSRSKGDAYFSFTTRNNDIVTTSYKVVFDSYRTAISDKESVKYNVETLERSPHLLNCLYVGETEVYTPINYGYDSSHPTVFGVNQKKHRTQLKPDLTDRHPTSWFRNQDGSNQLLVQYNNNSLDLFDTMSGELILGQEFPPSSFNNIHCFYKKYIASYVGSEFVEIVDITTKEKKHSFKPSTHKFATYMFDEKLAYAHHDTIVLLDLESGKEIQKVVIDTSDLTGGDDDIDCILAVTFDKWRLVVAIMIEYNYHVLQIYDMNDDFKLLQTIHDPTSLRLKTKLALLPNGSIVVEDTNLTVYHFDHPSIYEKITVGFYDDDKGLISLYNINAVDLTKVALEKLNISLDHISAVTVNKRINPESPFIKRMTCIFKAQQEFSRAGFLSAFEGWPKCSNICAPFAFTNDKIINTMALRYSQQYATYRPPGFTGSCLIVFEEVDPNNRWKFCKPEFDENLEIFRPVVKKISVDYTEIDYYAEKEK